MLNFQNDQSPEFPEQLSDLLCGAYFDIGRTVETFVMRSDTSFEVCLTLKQNPCITIKSTLILRDGLLSGYWVVGSLGDAVKGGQHQIEDITTDISEFAHESVAWAIATLMTSDSYVRNQEPIPSKGKNVISFEQFKNARAKKNS